MTTAEKMALAHKLILAQGDEGYKEIGTKCGVDHCVIARLFHFESGKTTSRGEVYYASGESLDKIIAALSRK